jgi:hypothetical protein
VVCVPQTTEESIETGNKSVNLTGKGIVFIRRFLKKIVHPSALSVHFKKKEVLAPLQGQ